VKRREVRPPKPRRDATIVDRVCPWFRFAARPLPWRTEPRDPYASLVSEIMLQQTQVSRVVERFNAFMVRFPDVAALAAAPESDVLGLWSGLGYYRRARNLLAAAKRVVSDFGGIIP
jgi:A/G-specific adenine glycosylase